MPKLRLGAVPMTPAERQARRRARLRRNKRTPAIPSARRTRPRPQRWAAAVAALIELQDEYRAWARQSTGEPGKLEAGREAEHYRRVRSRGAASDRPAARLRPRLTQEVHHRLHPNVMVNC